VVPRPGNGLSSYLVMRQRNQFGAVPWLVIVLIAGCLVGGVALAMGPQALRQVALAGLSVVVCAVAGVKFIAFSLLNYRGGRRLIAVLWGLLAVVFFLMFMAEAWYLMEALH